eukprot:4272503-Alexandrium_andersonii.AAC.1
MPASSASPELKAMVFWVVDQCFIACWPRARAPPHVDRRVWRQPVKSASTYVRIPPPHPAMGNGTRTMG